MSVKWISPVSSSSSLTRQQRPQPSHRLSHSRRRHLLQRLGPPERLVFGGNARHRSIPFCEHNKRRPRRRPAGGAYKRQAIGHAPALRKRQAANYMLVRPARGRTEGLGSRCRPGKAGRRSLSGGSGAAFSPSTRSSIPRFTTRGAARHRRLRRLSRFSRPLPCLGRRQIRGRTGLRGPDPRPCRLRLLRWRWRCRPFARPADEDWLKRDGSRRHLPRPLRRRGRPARHQARRFDPVRAIARPFHQGGAGDRGPALLQPFRHRRRSARCAR